MGGATSWLWTAGDGSPALVCFPHAGGAPAPYLRLARRVVPDCAVVRLPGRPPRSAEPAVASLGEAAAEVAAAIVRGGARPVGLWGHSFGAVLAWETGVELTRAGVAPKVVVLTGRGAPGREREHRHLWSDEDLVGFLRSHGGTPEEVLADRGMRELVLALLRADLALLGAHEPADRAALGAPLVVIGGADDPSTTGAGLAEWAAFTTGRCQVSVVPGGHFFPWQGEELVEALRAALGRAEA